MSGVWIGVLRLRRRGRQLPLSPYRGWQAWHHFTGLVGGVFLCTWIVSGWLSMDPLQLGAETDLLKLLQARQHYSDSAGADFPFSDSARETFAKRDVRSARFIWQAGRAVVLLTDRENRTLPFDPQSGDAVERSDAELFRSVEGLLPGSALTGRVRLEQPDRYWYSHHEAQPLPVLRGIYNDTAHSWIYLDPQTGELLQFSNDGLRLRRWLFDAMHSLDFPWLLAFRPVWDVVVWILSLAGLAISLSGVVIGWRRLRR